MPGYPLPMMYYQESAGAFGLFAGGSAIGIVSQDQGLSWGAGTPGILSNASAFSVATSRIISTGSLIDLNWSDDGGATWTTDAILPGGGLSTSTVWLNAVWIPGANRFVIANAGGIATPTDDNVAYSDDNGATWTGMLLTEDTQGRARGLAYAATTGRLVVGINTSGAGQVRPWYSDDFGSSWAQGSITAAGLSAGQLAIATDGSSFEAIWARGANNKPRLYVSADGIDFGAGTELSTLAVTDLMETRAYCWQPTLGIYIGVFRAGHVITGGTVLLNELGNYTWQSITAIPGTTRVVAVNSGATQATRVAYSDDGGATWTYVDPGSATTLVTTCLAPLP